MTKENKTWENKELFEQLAAIEHERWADWQKYLHSKTFSDSQGYGQVIGRDDFEHWRRQIKTDYKDLSEKEKDSDREQVMRYWKLIQKEIDKAVEGERRKWVCQNCYKYPATLCPHCADE